ncbi:MAG: DUF2062 domain-containing protein [Rhodospirillaceae bacterium]|nr:DUF2062 domain-containing protein [Rhodospirillaceae bacterium]
MSFLQKWQRLLRYRLIMPLLRSRHAPEHTARGTAIGIMWGFTPSIGIQMPAVFLTWVIARRMFNWDFNLVLALAWTWISNFVTALPLYYLLYVTGQIMFGRWYDLSGYESFLSLWQGSFSADQSLLEQLAMLGRVLVLDWGIAMAVGSVPWAAGMGLLGYHYSLQFVRAHRQRRAERMRRQKSHTA